MFAVPLILMTHLRLTSLSPSLNLASWGLSRSASPYCLEAGLLNLWPNPNPNPIPKPHPSPKLNPSRLRELTHALAESKLLQVSSGGQVRGLV